MNKKVPKSSLIDSYPLRTLHPEFYVSRSNNNGNLKSTRKKEAQKCAFADSHSLKTLHVQFNFSTSNANRNSKSSI